MKINKKIKKAKNLFKQMEIFLKDNWFFKKVKRYFKIDLKFHLYKLYYFFYNLLILIYF